MPKRSYDVTGPFPVFGKAKGESFTADLDADGVLHVDDAHAEEASLIEQGAIKRSSESK